MDCLELVPLRSEHFSLPYKTGFWHLLEVFLTSIPVLFIGE